MKLKDIFKKIPEFQKLKNPKTRNFLIYEIYIVLFYKNFHKIYVTRNG